LQISKNNSISSSIFGIYRLLIFFFSIIIIYFAKTIVIPLTIAALLTFLLSPLVIKLEKWIGRIASILSVVVVVFSIFGFTGYIITKQLFLFGSNFNNYYENIQSKLKAFQFTQGGILNRIGHAIGNLKEGLSGEPNTVDNVTKVSPIDVKLIDLSSNFTSFVESLFGSLFNVLGMTGIVILLVIFMLLNREDIRGRIIKLIGQNRISSTTNAMNEASERVFRYLCRLFIVNIWFGICITTGLYLIGIPNAILWGCVAAILRFIPYIGSWIAAIIPIALSFIITNTWFAPIATISFFISLEMITAYVIEPYYYGIGTGVSSFALIVAAIVWTWLWGPIGLLLSTPLTVCLVVLGQYVSNMNFLRVLLSQEQALTPAEECYHRLLSFDSSESMDVIESYLQKNSLISLYDSILIPVIAQTEKDFHLELIDIEQKEDLYQSVREIVEFLSISEQKEMSPIPERKGNILCLPAHAIRDEIGVDILAQLLFFESFDVHHTTRLHVSEIFELVDKENPDAICIGAVAPSALSKIRFLCAKLHQRKPQLPMIICLWGFSEVDSQILDKLNSAGATKVVVTLSQAVHILKEIRSSK
jgi:predicted PurR-regulated permease PerM